MQSRQQNDDFNIAWQHGLPINIDVANKAAWGFPVPEELFLTEEEIKEWRPKIATTL